MTVTIRIGETDYQAAAPEDLERQLRASSGLGVDETRLLLDGEPLASAVARALIPFLADAPSLPDLAHAIDQAGKQDVLAQARRLYAPPPQRPRKKRTPDAGE